MRAQGHLPPHAVVHVRTSAEAPRGARHRPPGRTDGFRRDNGNEAAVAEKCKGRREEILQVTHVKRVFNGTAYIQFTGRRGEGQSILGLEIRKPNFFFFRMIVIYIYNMCVYEVYVYVYVYVFV